ncbi:MAG TPA: ribonuclease E/G, partial [Streptomyces sp.]|nr:ribonuclease E/G [Streptomyces sp.]
LTERLQKWTSDVDVFATYRIDEQLMKALDRKVWLPSGGSLVIDRTEAMIVVDVNTGKFTGQGGNLEETVTRNNLEAAEEIVRQLRLRDLGGIIVIDFIDMVLESNRDLVLRRLLECLGRDRTKHQVAEVTSLGLVQMTRKRVGQGLLESFSEACVHCNGRGVLVHMEQPAAGGGKKGRKRGKGGATQEPQPQPHPVPLAESGSKSEQASEQGAETAPGRAVAQEQKAAPAKEFTPDDALYGSVAEAEASASGRGGRTRRRGSRKASAPQGAPQESAEQESPERELPEREPVATRNGQAAAEDESTPKGATGPGNGRSRSRNGSEAGGEAAASDVSDAGGAQGVGYVGTNTEAAPAARTRRRAGRKASAPAGSPSVSDEGVVTVVAAKSDEQADRQQPEPVPEPEVASEPDAAPVRARRRASRKASAPAGSPSASDEAGAIVLPASEREAQPQLRQPEPEVVAEPDAAPVRARRRATRSVSSPSAESAEGEGEDGAAKSSKKASAKKPASKKAPAKKPATSAKKPASKKSTAKKPAASKKTAAAEQDAPSSVSAPTIED